MFREEIVCTGGEIVSTPSPRADGDVLPVLASRDGRDRSSGQVPSGNDVSFGRVRAARARLLVIVFSCAFKQSMASFGP